MVQDVLVEARLLPVQRVREVVLVLHDAGRVQQGLGQRESDFDHERRRVALYDGLGSGKGYQHEQDAKQNAAVAHDQARRQRQLEALDRGDQLAHQVEEHVEVHDGRSLPSACPAEACLSHY